MAETITSTQPQAEVAATVHCTLCGELATVQTKDLVPLCGIPGNHPEYDHDDLLPLTKKF